MSTASGLDLALAALFMASAAAALLVAIGARWLIAGAARPREAVSWGWRLAWPLMSLFERPAAWTLGVRTRRRVERQLQQSGAPRWLTADRHRAACWVQALLAMAVIALLLTGWPGPRPGDWVAPAAGLFFGVLRSLRLRDRAQARQRQLLRQLPFFLDVITISVEAGLNLGAALSQAVDRGPPGAMRDELALVLRDLRAGRSHDEAMRALSERIDLPAMSSLVTALSTARKQGLSLGPILRAQSEQRRGERFMRAEKLAMQAPVKMLLPLVLFIFPGTFAILLFPVFSRLLAEGVL
jgi:tight adherence protein C